MSAALILGDEPRIVVAVARSLARRGIGVDVATLGSGPSLSSRAIRRCLSLPAPDGDPDYFLAMLLERVEGGGYARLLPVSDTALATVARHWSALHQVVSIGCPPPPIVGRVLDKAQTVDIAREVGVPVPGTVVLRSRDEATMETLPWPIIAKPKGKGVAHRVPFKVRRFDRADELMVALEQWPTIASDCVFQEYCDGVGVGVEVLMDRGRPLVRFQHRRIKEFPRSGGVSVIAVSEPVDAELADHAVRLLQRLEWDGPAMVEFRVDMATRRAVLMEVNGRYWGSLALSIRAGIDFPWLDWQRAEGRCGAVREEYRTGVRVRWSTGLLERLHADVCERRTAVGSLRSFLATLASEWGPGTHDMVWSWRDPAPALSETWHTVKRIAWLEIRRGLTHLIPHTALAIRAQSRLLGGRARTVFVRKAVLRAVGVGSPRIPTQLAARSFLFVCHGNIIRSPMAAALLRHATSRGGSGPLAVESAGLHAIPLKPADPRAVAAAERFGVSLRDHRASPVTPELVEHAEAIFVMDRFNEAELLARFPMARGKVYLLATCHRAPCSIDIDDPYRGQAEDVSRCFEVLQERIEELTKRIVPVAERQEMTPAVYAERRAVSSR